MILTCPKCATRYIVDDGEMRPEGRKVKCGACGEEWRVSVDGEAYGGAAPVETPYLGSPAPAKVAATPVFEVVGPETAPREEVVVAAPPVLESLFVSPITTDSKPAASKGSGLRSNLLLAVVILAVLAVAAYAFRVEIVRLAPKTAPFYSALGVSMKSLTPVPAKPPSPAPSPPHG
jgi:predicted Zn finger-like uncharacterized protein